MRISSNLRQAVIAVMMVVCCSAFAGAQCTSGSDSSSLQKNIKKQIKCNNKAFGHGPNASCVAPPAPACAGTLGFDAVALGYGANNPAAASVDSHAVSAQLSCQKNIGKAIQKYLSKKYSLMLHHHNTAEEADAKARKLLDKLPTQCGGVIVAQDASGVILPSVGPQCAGAIGSPGNTVDGTKLTDCVHTLVQVWYDYRYGPQAPQSMRPNIVMILTDDQRWDTIDSKHSPFGTDIMPHVRQELEFSGVTFPEGFMTTPLCCPSRSSLMKGQYAHNTGVHGNMPPNGGASAFDDATHLGLWMQNAGYKTGFYGKYLNGYKGLWDETLGEPPYIPPGWTEWHVFKDVKYFDYSLIENGIEVPFGSTDADYSTDVVRDKAVAFINASAPSGQPFFLYFAPKAPHGPWEPAPRHVGMFSSATPWRPPSYNEPDVTDKPLWLQNTAELSLQDQSDLDAIRIAQLEMLQADDEAVEAIMQALRDNGIADNTFVVYLSDNGWSWGEHRRQAKNIPYEEAIRTALFVRYPKLAPLARTDMRFALNIDLAPTFAELAGATVPIAVDGQSLVKVLDGTQPAWRTDFMTEGYAANHIWATVRQDEWKYTEYTTGELELYNLTTDPYELTNVAYDPANSDCVSSMATRLREIRPGWPADASEGGEDPED